MLCIISRYTNNFHLSLLTLKFIQLTNFPVTQFPIIQPPPSSPSWQLIYQSETSSHLHENLLLQSTEKILNPLFPLQNQMEQLKFLLEADRLLLRDNKCLSPVVSD